MRDSIKRVPGRFRLFGVLLTSLSLVPVAPSFASTSGEDQTSSAETQKSVAITIYNVNLGLVRDRRDIQLPRGETSLNFAGVASQINPATVHIRSLTEPGALSVVEQNYEYDLLSPQKLLDKYVGKSLTLVLRSYVNQSEQLTPTEAVLLANNNGAVWQIGDKIVINPSNIAEIRFPQLPESLIAKPTLVWRLANDRLASHSVEASYLTGGINWRADYVMLVNPDETRSDITGWVTIENNSGAEYRNAELKLVAGDIHRAENRQAYEMRMREELAAKAARDENFKEESFFEYHLYTLQRRTTIKNAQTKQISMLDASGVGSRKQFVIYGQPYYYHGYNNPGEPIKEKIGVYIEFANSEKNGLGKPLPAGIVRLYKADSSGGQQFIGEDRIDHTPKDEMVKVKVGDAFDIVGERKMMDYRAISSRVYEYAYQIVLRNHKKEAVTIVVNEPIGGDWEMLTSSHEWTKTAAFAARFNVPVAADGTATLSYRVRVRW
ncbi:MAG TPA: DUF4139 domain-containing protein [Blastocatellia bacterium]|nr:DUF4139 domain-containing protein [Blastocatellia bacterium]